jgi:hypothetical protein
MARDRFELLLKFWHFSDNHKYHSNQDRLIKLKPLLDLLKARFSSVYSPGAVITIDETMIPWRGRQKNFFKKKLKRGEAYGLQNKEGIKLIMWKDKKRCFDDIHKTFAFSSCGRNWKNKFSK